jgi:hypothetical protein
VKPLVLQEAEWIHAIGMETKEHLFLFLPFLAILEVALIKHYGTKIDRKTGIAIALAIVIIGFIVAVEGHLVSSAARAALEVA